MYDLNCPVLNRDLHLDADDVLSTHRLGAGVVVYLRCACGTTAMWSSSGTTLHPRPASDVAKVA